MGRYRPPPAKKSPYITREGYTELDSELKQLWKRRAEVTQALGAAAAEGDRSENAEYIYRKKQLREIDHRLRYLQKRLAELTIVDQQPSDLSRIFFGAWVRLEDDAGQQFEYRIVGPDEFDRDKAYISMDSPLARSLLKHQIDDEITVQTPAGQRQYFVINIRYQ